MKQRLRNIGDNRKIDRCLFCNRYNVELTREHTPSKILLDEPLPENLPITYTCKDCNSSFSIDEEYFACILEASKCHSIWLDDLVRFKVRRTLQKNKELYKTIANSFDQETKRFSFDLKRLKHIAIKLAICHLAFEMNEIVNDNPNYFDFFLRDEVNDRKIEDFDTLIEISVICEISKCYENMIILESSQDTRLFYAWQIVQEGQYRYMCAFSDDKYIVRIVIGEYTFFEMHWDCIN